MLRVCKSINFKTRWQWHYLVIMHTSATAPCWIQKLEHLPRLCWPSPGTGIARESNGMCTRWTWHSHKLLNFGMVSCFKVIVHILTYTSTAFSTKHVKPSPSSVQSFLGELCKLLKLYQWYDNKKCHKWIEKYMADMVEMLKVVRKELDSEKSASKLCFHWLILNGTTCILQSCPRPCVTCWASLWVRITSKRSCVNCCCQSKMWKLVTMMKPWTLTWTPASS